MSLYNITYFHYCEFRVYMDLWERIFPSGWRKEFWKIHIIPHKEDGYLFVKIYTSPFQVA